MYGVPDKMSQDSSRQQINPSPAQNVSLSPELREVMHMLAAIEQGASPRGSSSGR